LTDEPLDTLKVPDHVSELIGTMHPYLKKRVRAALKTILSNPASGKSLKNELAGLQSYRVGSFRIIYRLSGGVIELVALGPRKQIYNETYRVLRKG
jgi:mRNA-degrading endonuclease RelE of RelBE toxin-antitoxin system